MRPQLLDRFGLCVNVATMQDTKARTQMVLDRLAYEQARRSFCTDSGFSSANGCIHKS